MQDSALHQQALEQLEKEGRIVKAVDVITGEIRWYAVEALEDFQGAIAY